MIADSAKIVVRLKNLLDNIREENLTVTR